MDSFWIAATAIVTIALLVLGVAQYRRTYPKRRLVYEIGSVSMMRVQGDELEVRLNGSVINDPYYVSIAVASDTRYDIPSASFNAGDPIEFHVGRPIEAVVNESIASVIRMESSEEVVRIPAQLIKGRTAGRIEFITAGPPEMTPIVSSLIDIRLTPRPGATQRNNALPAILSAITVGLTGGVLTLLVAGLLSFLK